MGEGLVVFGGVGRHVIFVPLVGAWALGIVRSQGELGRRAYPIRVVDAELGDWPHEGVILGLTSIRFGIQWRHELEDIR